MVEDRIKKEAEKEMNRMTKIFDSVKVSGKGMSLDFYRFAKNYFEDGKHFFDKGDYIEAFEAFIIAWAYIDAGLKLKYFEVNTDLKTDFTSE